MVLYMAVTADEYELPLIVEENIIDLAKKMGTTSRSISTSIYGAKKRAEKKHKRTAYKKKIRYVRVEIDDGTDKEN